MSIRLRYTGIINFGSKLFSLITGLVFSAIVARSLSQADMGLWYFIDTNLAIFVILKSVIPFWLTRNYARGKDVASTGIIVNIVLSLPFFLGYVMILPFFEKVWISPLHFGFASSFIILHYILSSLTALVSAKNPERLAYSLAIGELVKLIGYPLITNYQLIGVITMTAFSHIVKIIYLLSSLKLSKKIEFRQVRVWIGSSWVLILGLIGATILQNLHKYILGLLSLESLGFYSIYNVITSQVLIANSLASGLYPKLLSGKGKSEDVEDALSLTTMFAIPMTLGGIILARDLVSIMGSKYLYIEFVNQILYVMFIGAFIKVFDNVFQKVAIGLEKTDIGTFDQKTILKSRIFVNNIIPYLGVLVSAPLLFTLVPSSGLIAVVYIQLGVTILLCLLRYILACKSIKFDIPIRRIVNYCMASIPMVLTLLILPRGKGSIIVVLEVLFGFLIYMASLWMFDKETRKLLSSIISETKSMVEKKASEKRVNQSSEVVFGKW